MKNEELRAQLSALGRKTEYRQDYAPEVLETFVNKHPDNDYRVSIASEASYLYAPLAHRLGLYKIKSELEDLSLKYTNREVYDMIASNLNQTKAKRDKYIAAFIAPIKKLLEEEGFKFEIKGRTKSIS